MIIKGKLWDFGRDNKICIIYMCVYTFYTNMHFPSRNVHCLCLLEYLYWLIFKGCAYRMLDFMKIKLFMKCSFWFEIHLVCISVIWLVNQTNHCMKGNVKLYTKTVVWSQTKPTKRNLYPPLPCLIRSTICAA